MENKEETFAYTYCAAQQEEIEKIRNKYLESPTDKLQQLRALDRGASRKARIWALSLGIIGALILGTGMSLIMTELGVPMGEMAMPIGIAVGLAGMILVALAYPVYNTVLKNQRRRIAPQILQLTEELLQS